jgi:hypothetical protein
MKENKKIGCISGKRRGKKNKMQKAKIKNLLLAVVWGVGIAGTTAVLIRPVLADEINNHHPLIRKLVKRFGLNADEVQDVFFQHREEKRTERQARFEERLAEAVAAGTITEAQKEAILAKKAEIQSQFQERHQKMMNLSWEEKQNLKNQHRQEMAAWAEENGLEWPLWGIGFGPRGGHFGPKLGG